MENFTGIAEEFRAAGACVEIARIGTEVVAMRNSRDPHGPALICPRDAIVALMDGLRDGEFDHLVS